MHRTSDNFVDPLSPEIRINIVAVTDEFLKLLPIHEVRERVSVIRGYLSLIGRYPTNTRYSDALRKAMTQLIRLAEKSRKTELAERLRFILETF